MKFTAKVTKSLTIKLPALIVQHMGLVPDDIIEVSLEHALVALIVKSEKFFAFCRERGSIELNKYHEVYQEDGGNAKLGSFRPWLVKHLRLHEQGLKYWTGNGGIEEAYPDGLIPSVQPVGSSVQDDKTEKGSKK